VNSEITSEFNHLYSSLQENDEKTLIKRLRNDLTDEEIDNHICRNRDLVLDITEECNFRCKYCAFSGIYERNRTHNPKRMEFNTAEKAIDLFLKNILNKKRKLKINTISIGFYGGEPLLEFRLLKDIVKYAKKSMAKKGLDKVFELQFRLSTNGYLLNKKVIVDFLIKNRIGIDVSLDGPKEEHDKFRVTINLEKSWKTIWNNLNYIYIKFPEFANKKITYLATLHPFHDFEQIDRFFMDNPKRFDVQKLLVNEVSKAFLKDSIKKKWFNQKIPQVSHLKRMKDDKRLDSKFSLKKISSNQTLTAMCFPGEVKFFVHTDGEISICERVKNDINIGNVYHGLDYNAIRRIQRLWNEQIIKNRCWECPALSICYFCVAHSEDRDGISLNCTFKGRFQNILSQYLTDKENEKIRSTEAVKNAENNIKDYIKQL